MIDVLLFSDRDVRKKLFGRVAEAKGLLLLTGVRHGPHMKPAAERSPFVELDAELGEWVSQLIVADDGSLEGMWRDPIGDLADALYPKDHSAAFDAANGYVLFVDGEVDAIIKKSSPDADRWTIQEALAAAHRSIPRPDPGARRAATVPKPEPARPAQRIEAPKDAWTLLGIERTATAGDARRSFRTLIAQYHPDKVAHLAPEFRELAERRTRELLAAWSEIEEALSK